MGAFEAFSSDLEARPLAGVGVEPPEDFDKKKSFRSIFQRFRGKALAGVMESGAPEKF